MYNESLKKRFLESIENERSRVQYTSAFHIFEPYEQAWGADVCTVGVEDLQNMVNNLPGTRTSNKRSKMYYLRSYISWCLENEIDGACDAVFHINAKENETIRYRTVKSPAHLQSYLDLLLDPESKNTVDHVFRCYFWLAYAGFSEENLLKVRCSDVNLREMVVTYNGIDYPIYRQAVNCIRTCAENTQFAYFHANYDTIRDRVGGDLLLRGIKSQPNQMRLRAEISKRAGKLIESGKTDIRLSYYRTWISGMFYRVFELEQTGVKPDFSHYVNYQFSEKINDNQRMVRDAARNYAARKVRDYMEDYNLWKKTLL